MRLLGISLQRAREMLDSMIEPLLLLRLKLHKIYLLTVSLLVILIFNSNSPAGILAAKLHGSTILQDANTSYNGAAAGGVFISKFVDLKAAPRQESWPESKRARLAEMNQSHRSRLSNTPVGAARLKHHYGSSVPKGVITFEVLGRENLNGRRSRGRRMATMTWRRRLDDNDGARPGKVYDDAPAKRRRYSGKAAARWRRDDGSTTEGTSRAGGSKISSTSVDAEKLTTTSVMDDENDDKDDEEDDDDNDDEEDDQDDDADSGTESDDEDEDDETIEIHCRPTNPCKNRGICKDLKKPRVDKVVRRFYSCICLKDFKGEHCETGPAGSCAKRCPKKSGECVFKADLNTKLENLPNHQKVSEAKSITVSRTSDIFIWDVDNMACYCSGSLGKHGPKCNTDCSKGFYGRMCIFRCSANCRSKTRLTSKLKKLVGKQRRKVGGGECSRKNGECKLGCEKGWEEPFCENKLPCVEGQTCTHGRCEGQDCECNAGYNGTVCNQKCINSYGMNCKNPCGQCTSGKCNHINGNCTVPSKLRRKPVCKEDYEPPRCETRKNVLEAKQDNKKETEIQRQETTARNAIIEVATKLAGTLNQDAKTDIEALRQIVELTRHYDVAAPSDKEGIEQFTRKLVTLLTAHVRQDAPSGEYYKLLQLLKTNVGKSEELAKKLKNLLEDLRRTFNPALQAGLKAQTAQVAGVSKVSFTANKSDSESEAKRRRRRQVSDTLNLGFTVALPTADASRADLQQAVRAAVRSRAGQFRSSVVPGMKMNKNSVRITAVTVSAPDDDSALPTAVVAGVVVVVIVVLVSVGSAFYFKRKTRSVVKQRRGKLINPAYPASFYTSRTGHPWSTSPSKSLDYRYGAVNDLWQAKMSGGVHVPLGRGQKREP